MVNSKKILNSSVTVNDCFILSEEMYLENKDTISMLDDGDYWWLSTKGKIPETTKAVFEDEVMELEHTYHRVGVRPVLEIDYSQTSLVVGDEIEFAGEYYRIFDKSHAIANNVITHLPFDSDSNDYETSQLKHWLHDWFERNLVHGNLC